MQSEYICQLVATNIKEAIKRKYGGISMRRLARESGVLEPTIAFILHPERRKSPATNGPTLVKIAMLADALDVQTWELLYPGPSKIKNTKTK